MSFNRIAVEDRAFMRTLLRCEADTSDYSYFEENYDKTYAVFFAQTNNDPDILGMSNDQATVAKTLIKHHVDLASYYLLCIKRAIEKGKSNIDLIGKCEVQTQIILEELLKKHNIDTSQLKIRLINPYPLQRSTMQALYQKAAIDEHPVMVSSHEAVFDALNAGCAIMYQACFTNDQFATDLEQFFKNNNCPKLAKFFKDTACGVRGFLFSPTHHSDNSRIENLAALMNDSDMYAEYAALRENNPEMLDAFLNNIDITIGKTNNAVEAAISPMVLEINSGIDKRDKQNNEMLEDILVNDVPQEISDQQAIIVSEVGKQTKMKEARSEEQSEFQESEDEFDDVSLSDDGYESEYDIVDLDVPPETKPTRQFDYDFLVIGAGPGGLMSAYQALKQGKKVLVLEMRSEEEYAQRPQLLALDSNVVQILQEMIDPNEKLDDDDLKFLDKLVTSSVATTSNVQRFIQRRIAFLQASASAPTIQFQTTMSSVNFESGKATLLSKQNGREKHVTFNHLIVADGANTQTVQLVQENLSKENAKLFTKSSSRMLAHQNDTYHFGAVIEIEKTNHAQFSFPKNEVHSDYVKDSKSKYHLRFLRFDPRTHKVKDKMKMKGYFIGSISKQDYEWLNPVADSESREDKARNDEIRKQRQTQYIAQHLQPVVAEQLGLPAADIKIQIKPSKNGKKTMLSALTFKGSSSETKVAAVHEKNHGIYLVGDAQFSPHYILGHGANHAMLSAFEAVSGPLFGDEAYHERLAQHTQDYNKDINAKRWFVKKAMTLLRISRWSKRGRKEVVQNINQSTDSYFGSQSYYLKSHLRKNDQTQQDAVKSTLLAKFAYALFEPDSDYLKMRMKGLVLTKRSYDEINVSLALWEQIIKKNPYLSKLYISDILESLNSIQENFIANLSDSDPEMKAIKIRFQNIVHAFQQVKNDSKFNQDLIGITKYENAQQFALENAFMCADLKTVQAILKVYAPANDLFFNSHARENYQFTRELLNAGVDPLTLCNNPYDGNKPMPLVAYYLLVDNDQPKDFRFFVEALIAYQTPGSKVREQTKNKDVALKLDGVLDQFFAIFTNPPFNDNKNIVSKERMETVITDWLLKCSIPDCMHPEREFFIKDVLQRLKESKLLNDVNSSHMNEMSQTQAAKLLAQCIVKNVFELKSHLKHNLQQNLSQDTTPEQKTKAKSKLPFFMRRAKNAKILAEADNKVKKNQAR